MRYILTAAVFSLLVPALAAGQDGKAIFEGKGNCYACHGKDAKGTPLAPNLTDSVWINVDGSLEAIRELVSKGVPKPKQHPAPMPPMGGAKLSQKEIDAVAAYVAGLAAKAGGG